MPLPPLLPCCPSIDPVTFVKLAAFVWSKGSERGVTPLHGSLGFSHYLDLAVESEKLLSLRNTCSIGDPLTPGQEDTGPTSLLCCLSSDSHFFHEPIKY